MNTKDQLLKETIQNVLNNESIDNESDDDNDNDGTADEYESVKPRYSFGEDNQEYNNEWVISNDCIPNPKRVYHEEEYYKVFESNLYRNRDKTINGLRSFDIVITYSWDLNHYGPVSAWYDAFELWFMVQSNTLPSDLGGKTIALLFPDCPNTDARVQILKSIFFKYNIDEFIFNQFCKSIFFIDQPKELILSIGQIPYRDYDPSHLVFVDGNIPEYATIQADNIYLQTINGLPKKKLQRTNYNFIMVYLDGRIHTINELYKKEGLGKDLTIEVAGLPNTLLYDDIRRVNFSSFRKFPVDEAQSLQTHQKKRFLLYITPKNRSIYKTFDSVNKVSKWSKQELDDILNAIPESCLNPLAIKIKHNQTKLFNYIKEENKKVGQKQFSEDQLIAIHGKESIFNNGYTAGDVIEEDPKAHLILVGLNDDNRNFEEALLARAITRGINISTEVYLQKDLPIKDIHSLYDVYLFTQPNRWTTTRFLPEAVYHQKKVIITTKAKLSFKWNIPLDVRYQDVMKYLMFIAEDDVFRKPKSKLAKHLLNIWS